MATEVSRKPGVIPLFPNRYREPDLHLQSTPRKRERVTRWALALAPFVILWGALIWQLSVEWRVNAQYSHGWLVPFLCLSLFLSRWQRASGDLLPGRAPLAGWSRTAPVSLFIALAFLWLPTRLFQEANPEWRLISWLLAFEAIGLSLATIWMRSGPSWTAQLAFPICFFLVAVPWPTVIEAPLIQVLTRICAAVTVEVAGFLGIPAIQHGNVIEVATGSVGIDEACSGIRSFQSTLMISLFLGELYRLNLWRRIVLAPLGFLVALLFNVCRTSFLTWVGATKGIPAIARYHDPAGVTIMIACLVALWGLALLMRPRSTGTTLVDADVPPLPLPSPALLRLSIGLLTWVAVSEVGIEAWYRIHEWRVPRSPAWTVNWPRGNPTYGESPINEKATRLLRYDEGLSAGWQNSGGTWRMIYLRWLPGRTAAHLANLHTPDICLTAGGHAVEALPNLIYLPVRGLKLPFREYILNEGGETAYVFYCLWEDRAATQFFKTEFLTYGNRVTGALAGERNCGERSLEVMLLGAASLKDAEAALVGELNQIVVADKLPAESNPRS